MKTPEYMLHKNRTAPANGVTGGGGVRISNLSQSLAASLCLHLTLRRFDDLMEGGATLVTTTLRL